VLHIFEEAAYDLLGVQLGDLFEGDGEIKEIATLRARNLVPRSSSIEYVTSSVSPLNQGLLT
jgi:hypothetical protein